MSYEIIPGDPASPVILHVPHASRELIDSGLLLGPAEVAEELDHLTDAYTDVIASRAAGAAARRPWTLVNRLSRLVVDPERFPGDEEEMLASGMGPVYTHGHAGRRLRDADPVRDAALLTSHFLPYAEAMTTLVTRRMTATGRAVIIDVHSYATEPLPYELHGDGPRPPVCLGTDEAHTPDWLRDAAATVFPETGVNSPFAGCYVPLDYWGRDRAVSALMIEIRRDQYMREPGGEPGPGLDRLARSLAALVDAIP
ncbi:putative N-formylglutamate aminohydrolase [Actinoplanes missouriensis 431]|uniref:Putative N-formylglutamate aminohydrolase n=1 Tax=Actinoplanes missouriensis (strain ATCC 14538 / DSM 43046 / CBS 188.64 / JCM 3121 / NBRC 102363 / NCIMB 12654 / NRRL B-3342 / UNCC 431) TaxID=512565 RepID=I0H7E2_ACTM4|nr:N-formylglutamate amidohydrolase [Actinoplanes missouriensis]BAL88929.1 putative N-formylglutamate aminohydrolase [Actinoplanes missouriensis 431]